MKKKAKPALRKPSTPQEFEDAERLQELGLATLNPDGTVTLTPVGELKWALFQSLIRKELEKHDNASA